MPHSLPPDPSRQAPATQDHAGWQPQGRRWGVGAQSALAHLVHEQTRKPVEQQHATHTEAHCPRSQ
ncbi:MAG TPA: hypothetical protein VHL79_19950 [Ramlibacter sp.]|jgi:hypothetical protein|nr:hypothetical protein [Ramlibacter sp.]